MPQCAPSRHAIARRTDWTGPGGGVVWLSDEADDNAGGCGRNDRFATGSGLRRDGDATPARQWRCIGATATRAAGDRVWRRGDWQASCARHRGGRDGAGCAWGNSARGDAIGGEGRPCFIRQDEPCRFQHVTEVCGRVGPCWMPVWRLGIHQGARVGSSGPASPPATRRGAGRTGRRRGRRGRASGHSRRARSPRPGDRDRAQCRGRGDR